MISEIIALIFGLMGIMLGAILTYYFGLKQLLISNRINYKTKLYFDLFDKLRDFNSTKNELNNLLCNAQLFASGEVLDFLNNLNIDKGIREDTIHHLLVLIRKDLGLKKRKRLRLYFQFRDKKSYKKFQKGIKKEKEL